ncbi:MAG: sigma-54 dependent transcriptional regulator [Gemmatimonadaceae bacterium]
MPDLALLSLSESFAGSWSGLAADCGFTLATVSDAAALAEARRQPTVTVGVIAAGGHEGDLERTVIDAAGAGAEIAAVGAVHDHRIASAVVRAGAAEYFALPDDMDLLRAWLTEKRQRFVARHNGQSPAGDAGARYHFDGIMGTSRALNAALDRAAKVIPHGNVTVLIGGETGTGKELLARAIHSNGPRAAAPFVDINCAAIPEQLLESELFGYEKGAFTDASAAKPGLFELADGGTLFLDEIGHLALTLQGKVLRALEERTIRRVGGTVSIPVDVRVIAATHLDLVGAVQRGVFREDLYYRLNVVPIELPPLRSRPEDIVVLARHFLARFAQEHGLEPPTLSTAAEAALAGRDWPGNVRELRNVVERTLLLASGGTIEAADVPPPDGPRAPHAGPLPFPARIDEIVRSAASAMLEMCNGNKSEASRRLGISRPRLQRLLDARSPVNAESDALLVGLA